MTFDHLDPLVTRLLDMPTADRDRRLRDAGLDEDETRYVYEVLSAADAVAVAAYEPPALEDDPVAAMLGLLPDPECRLSPQALARERRNAGLDLSQLAAKLSDLGWTYKSADLFRWETRSADDVPPAVINAIAHLFATTTERLTTTATAKSSPSSAVDIIVNSELFHQLAERWARAVDISVAAARAALKSRSLSTVHRGDEPDPDQLLATLEALVTAVESRGKDSP